MTAVPGPAVDLELESARRRLRMAVALLGAELPHLAGLAHAVVYHFDARWPTAAISADGQVALNPTWFTELAPADAMFVIAHELMHLALHHHSRSAGYSEPVRANLAEDAVINDELCAVLGRDEPPAGGVCVHGARHRSVEELLACVDPDSQRSWSSPRDGWPESATGDLLDADAAGALFPPRPDAAGLDAIPGLVRDAIAIAAVASAARSHADTRGGGHGSSAEVLTALASAYRAPWELALRAWLEGNCGSQRTFARPSRRGAGRADIVLPGRRRTSNIVRIILDTSGSMTYELPRLLGIIAEFCQGANAVARVIQCGDEITDDRVVEPEDLATMTIKGFGGGNLATGITRYAEDPATEAVVIITDGYEYYPDEPPPFQVLWALVRRDPSSFQPPYGTVVQVA